MFDTMLSLDDLKEFSFDDFNKYGAPLKLNNYIWVKDFFDKEYDFANPLFYHCNPLYNDILNTNNYKYIKVQFNNDECLIYYKVIQIIKTKKIRIYDKPISLMGNHDNEKEIINILAAKDFICFSFKEKYNDYYKDFEIVPFPQDNDYYYDVDEYSKKYNGRYIHHKRIKRYVENSDFKVLFWNQNDKENLIKLKETWAKNKDDEITGETEFNKIIKERNDNIYYLNIYYKDELISTQILLLCGDYAINLYGYNIGRDKIDDEYLKASIMYIDDVSIYFMVMMAPKFNIKRIYILGANPKHIKLIEHKERNSSGVIKYNTIK